MYFSSTNFPIFFLSTSFSSGLRGGCRRFEDGPLHVNMTLMTRFACVWYCDGKRKKMSLKPTRYSNQSFSEACQRMSHIALASLAASEFPTWIFSNQSFPCSRLRNAKASRQSLRQYRLNINAWRTRSACCCMAVGGRQHMALSQSSTGTFAPSAFTALAMSCLSFSSVKISWLLRARIVAIALRL
jgi:hypothetical protein